MKKTAMKRITAFLLGAAALTAIPAAARQLTPNEALQRAFTSVQTSGASIKALNNDTQLLYTVSAGNQAGAYVMTAPHTDGYVIVSADDVAVPVLGYSDNGTFDASDISPELNYWLNEYGREIAWAIANNVAPAKAKAIAEDFAPIEPMCTTKWNQDAPYNDSCPIDPSTGKRSVTGCVATAMAQVMKYHNWPEVGKGSITYTYNGMNLSMNFSEAQFDWANMTNVYTSASTDTQKTAVATLMEACGKSVKMMYSSNASGAYSGDVPKALMNYLNYASTAVQLSRSNFGLRSWQEIIYSQLVDFGPVYYSGQTSDISGQSAGHAYVCDGYRSDGYFHINWGWGGMSDGYFRLTALDPDAQGIGGSSSGFNYSQAIVAAIQKPDNAKPFRLFVAKDLNVNSEQALLGDRVVFSGGYYYYGATRITGVGLGILAINDDTNEETYLPFSSGASYDNGQGVSTMTVVTPTTLAEGTYTLRPVYTINNVRTFMYNGLGATYITMSVKNGTATFKRPTAANVTADKLETLSNVIIGSRFMAQATLTNPTAKEFYNKIYTSILSKESDGKYSIVSKGNPLLVDVPGGETITVRYYENCPSTVNEGEYYLAVLNATNSILGTPIPITVKRVQGGVSLQLNTLTIVNSSAVDKENVQVNVKLSCLNGSYSNILYLGFQPSYGGNPLDGIYTPVMFFEKGDPYTFTITGAFNTGVPGTQYLAALYAISSDGTLTPIANTRGKTTFPFTLAEPSGITAIEADEDNSPAEYFDLMGRKLNTEPESGLYIMRKGGKTTKIIK